MRKLNAAIVAAALLVAGRALAGSLDPTNAPGPTMHTLEEIYGKVQNLAPQTLQTLSATTAVVQAGYYAPTNLTQVDTDLATANIIAGVTIFGVEGTGGATGNATVDQVLSGQTFSTASGIGLTGTMPNRGAVAITPGTTVQTIVEGYHNGSGTVAGDSDLATGNIKSGVNIFGVNGASNVVDTTSGNAVAGNLLSGKKAWVKGAEVTGSIATRTLSATTTVVNAGNYAATNLAQVDADLATGNIKAGVNIFSVTGKTEVVDTTSGTAVAGDMLAGKRAWVDGAEVTGSIATRMLSATTTVVNAGNYVATNLTQVDADLATANIKAGVNIFNVTGKTEVVDTTSGDAVAGDVMSGKKAWADGVEVTGNIQTRTMSPTTTVVRAGYYAVTNLTQVETDLAKGNIATNVTIFGIAGTLRTNVVALVPKTGQTTSYQAGDDGYYTNGVAWPNPRFTVQANTNVVLDNLTGLMWARNAYLPENSMPWNNAIDYCTNLTHGGYDDWRLPNVRELQSLISYGLANPALCNTDGTAQWAENDPFMNVFTTYYWSSTTYGEITDDAWYVGMYNGYVNYDAKTLNFMVWPVRGGP